MADPAMMWGATSMDSFDSNFRGLTSGILKTDSITFDAQFATMEATC